MKATPKTSVMSGVYVFYSHATCLAIIPRNVSAPWAIVHCSLRNDMLYLALNTLSVNTAGFHDHLQFDCHEKVMVLLCVMLHMMNFRIVAS